ncbi:DUF4214 domain-containing protein [Vreelandella gomseomensis]|uniref:DUF4214 domain-containing protein n=1 Tax=Vreelandella gomseomensis TaxID=370766 RepID=A0ABU1GGE9_9GAMM|nr:DUF4214 domain-containing protein [Halomonas gomseomensis]MDR5876556.1 DUF4214 domain-containing protein [Halomonas gomseomensis]
MATQDIQIIYLGLLGRPADEEGLAYWNELIESGTLTLEQLRANIVNEQPEFADGPGQLSRDDFVTQLYLKLFGREADDQADYWIIGEGAGVNLDQLVLAFTEGASEEDINALDNRTTVAQQITDAGLVEEGEATTLLEDVTSDPETVTAAEQAIESLENDDPPVSPPTPTPPSQTFELSADGIVTDATDGADVVTGGPGDDVIRASQDADGNGTADDPQFEVGDVLDGGGGTDRLVVTDVDPGTHDLPALRNDTAAANIEILDIKTLDEGVAQSLRIDVADYSDDLTDIRITDGDSQADDVEVNNLAADMTIQANSDLGTLDIAGYRAGVSEQTTTLALTGGVTLSDIDDTSAATESLTIESTGEKGNTVTDLGDDGRFQGADIIITGDTAFAIDLGTSDIETVDGSQATGGLTLKGNPSATTLIGGAGNDTVNAGGNDVAADASVSLGAGDDVVSNLGAVAEEASFDGGEGTDTLPLQAVAAANVGAFSNFEVFDVNALNKTFDLSMLSAGNDIQEIVGSGATGAGGELTQVGAGVGFRATADMGTASDLVLTQATAGELAVTLDVDQTPTASASDDNSANVGVVATNATSVNAVFDSESVNAIDGGPITNVQTIGLTVGNDDAAVAGGATSINVDSGGENAENVLVVDDQTSDANGDSVLTALTITGDQDLDIRNFSATSGNDGTAIETVDAGAFTGDLRVDLGALANVGDLTLSAGAGNDSIDLSSLATGYAGEVSIALSARAGNDLITLHGSPDRVGGDAISITNFQAGNDGDKIAIENSTVSGSFDTNAFGSVEATPDTGVTLGSGDADAGLVMITGENAGLDSLSDADVHEYLEDFDGNGGFNDGYLRLSQNDDVAYVAVEYAGDTGIYEVSNSAPLGNGLSNADHLVTLAGVSTDDLTADNFASFL